MKTQAIFYPRRLSRMRRRRAADRRRDRFRSASTSRSSTCGETQSRIGEARIGGRPVCAGPGDRRPAFHQSSVRRLPT